MDQWEKISDTPVRHRAEMLRTLLESNNIATVVLNKQDSSYLFGHFEVYVHQAYAIKARQVLEQAHPA